VLITAKALMNPATELLPSSRINATLDRLETMRCEAFKMHSSNFDLDARINRVHLEVVLATRLPHFWILTLKHREVHLSQFPHQNPSVGA
jgi:hypothetical protein